MYSIDGNVAKVLGQKKVNQLLEQVDPFDTYQFGGRAAEPTAGFLVQNGNGLEALPVLKYSDGEFVDHYDDSSNMKVPGILGEFVYTGNFKPEGNDITQKALNELDSRTVPMAGFLVYDGKEKEGLIALQYSSGRFGGICGKYPTVFLNKKGNYNTV